MGELQGHAVNAEARLIAPGRGAMPVFYGLAMDLPWTCMAKGRIRGTVCGPAITHGSLMKLGLVIAEPTSLVWLAQAFLREMSSITPPAIMSAPSTLNTMVPMPPVFGSLPILFSTFLVV